MNGITEICYERAKQSAKNHMKNGETKAYLNELLVMDYYKKLM
jgi:hypothetical protein